MNEKIFKNISNHTSSNLRIYQDNYQQYATPLIIRKNSRKTTSNLLSKKSTKSIIPKYLINPQFALQKQKLLFDIEKENIKLKQQHNIKKALQKKLQKKLVESQKKCMSLQKFSKCQTQGMEGIQRTITSSLKKAFIIQPNQNYIQSITNQIELLTQEIKKNQEIILKIKQSKKYTRFLQNQQEISTFLLELKNMKRYRKKLKIQINRLKRIHIEKKNLRMKELIMQGQIQNSVQMQNIQIYKIVQGLKQEIKQTAFRKSCLSKKKQKLLQQIEQIKQRHNLTDQIIQSYYRPHSSKLSRTTYSAGFCSSKSSTQCRPLTSNLNDLVQLKQQDCQEQDSNQNLNYQLNKVDKSRKTHKDTIKQNAVSTVKVNSNVPSDDGQFLGVSCNKSDFDSKTIKQKEARKTIQMLQKKYFYQQDDFESEDYNSQKQYQSEQYDQQQHFESQQQNYHLNQEQNIQNHKSNNKMISVKEKPVEPQIKQKEKVWTRSLRGVSF